MTTPPVFVSGEVLTAAQMNSVGLWLIKTQTVGTTVSSVAVTSVFSSDFENYRVIYTGGLGSTTDYLKLSLGSATAAYYGSLFGSAYATGTTIGLGVNNQASFLYTGLMTSTYAMLSVDIFQPNLVKNTFIKSDWGFNLTGTGYSMFAGEHSALTAHTGFTITPTSGTLTGGTISIYGYRKG